MLSESMACIGGTGPDNVPRPSSSTPRLFAAIGACSACQDSIARSKAARAGSRSPALPTAAPGSLPPALIGASPEEASSGSFGISTSSVSARALKSRRR